ncbi:PREDICTED: uncharacterized protein LOC105450045 [Wasmannia auropunctata]|uniref:uncharacterized protein LOC105450045 n=1 Tax=Wasmannia auropunctata TaxID=64793 RepID=UPI0005EEE659|nr:PREDICTED: uncharacterized protein LOC105450045 [Wasmannia auropunctata]
MLSEDNSVKMIHSKHQQSVHQQHQQQNMRKSVGVMGTRRIFTTAFKIKVLDSYRNDKDCRQNQRATARKYGIHRRQIQKWLQCEEQLRNSIENGNTGTVSSTTASPTSVSKSDTVTEVTGSTVTPVTPALNLNLARQHGDELTTQQGPPPSHPPHGSAPSSPQYSLQTTTTGTILPLCLGTSRYPGYSSEGLRLYEELEDRVHIPEVHGYSNTQSDQDRNYYVLNGDGQQDAEAASANFDGRNEMKIYQTLTSYHSPHREHRYNVNDINNSARNNHSPNHHPQQREQSYGNVDSFDGKSYSLLLAPSMIKTEPASPDTAATSGPYEPMDSPGGPRAPLSSPVSHRGADSGGSSSSVHFVDSSRAPASPYLHVHAHEHAHTCPPLDSEKPIPSLLHEQERESEETTQHTEEKREEEMQKTEYCRTLIKEEVHLDEEEAYDEGEEVTASSCVDYQRPPVGGSSLVTDSSGSVSLIYDRNSYSLPSSPHDCANAGRSRVEGPGGRSSWSDSEVDSDHLISTNSLNSSGSFTRRRSFSLCFKLNVLDAYHRDKEVRKNQRATARKFGINRRQVQKWLDQEKYLRHEIALRGDLRQRLGPIQGDSPLDLTTTNYAPLRQVTNCVSLLRDRLEIEHERLPTHILGDGFISSQHPLNYQQCTAIEPSSEIESVAPCNLSCSIDSHTTMSTTSSYQDLSLRESCYTESSIKTYCYSPRANSVISNFSEGCEQRFSPLKRQHCMLAGCYDAMPSPKRSCERYPDMDDSYDVPPQDTPLCLVKPKSAQEFSRTELITKSINTVSTSNNPDAITFKPYLDNPVSKPVKKCIVQRDLSPISYNINNNNNNNSNCQIICNFNEGQNLSHNYDFELNLRVPWRPDLDLYRPGFPQRSAFVSVSSLYM